MFGREIGMSNLRLREGEEIKGHIQELDLPDEKV